MLSGDIYAELPVYVKHAANNEPISNGGFILNLYITIRNVSFKLSFIFAKSW